MLYLPHEPYVHGDIKFIMRPPKNTHLTELRKMLHLPRNT